MPELELGLQIAQDRPYLYTLSSKVGIIYIYMEPLVRSLDIKPHSAAIGRQRQRERRESSNTHICI